MTILVTGGGGFLGSAIVRRLRARGHAVRSLSRARHTELDALGVEQFQGDVANTAAVEGAAAGCQTIFHTAAKAGIWGRPADYQRTNVEGTRNVIHACRKHGIAHLIYTSSPSVVFDGRGMEGVDESVPYPDHYEAHYPRTKAEAERLVLQSNSAGLATVALRPHLIWGPGDNHLVPRIIARARAGRLRRLGRQSPLIGHTYIDNAADAHILAAERLWAGPGSGTCVAGRAFFLSQLEPVPLWDLVNGILDAAGLPPVSRSMPVRLAWLLGYLLEGIYTCFGWQSEPLMTRFLAHILSTAHWFNIEAARRDLGYKPTVSTVEGLRRLKQSLQPGN